MGTLVNEQTLTQKSVIRAWLLEHGRIDRRTALKICDCDRLGARIFDLRHDKDNPMNIVTSYRERCNRFGNMTRYAVYKLVKEESEVGI